MKFSVRRQDDAVSEIIGTILLISIVVIAASVIAVAVFSQPQPQKIPSLSAVISNQSQIVYIKHNGGDALPNGTFKVLVDGIDVTSSVIIPTTWSIGEMLTYSKPGTTPPSSVAIVYTGSGSAGVVLSSAYFVQYAGGGSPTGTMTATATPTPTPTPSVTGISPTAGPTDWRNLGNHHRHELYRGDFGILWRHRGNLVYGKQRYFDHRDQPGRFRRNR